MPPETSDHGPNSGGRQLAGGCHGEGGTSAMNLISRAFRGRPREQATAGRLPPGQYLTSDFPVLSAGPTPRTPLSDWTFSITGEVAAPRRWTWDEFRRL